MQYLSYQEAKAFSTPFFLLDENHLANQVDLIHKAFEKYWVNGLVAYSVKTNSLPYLAKVLYTRIQQASAKLRNVFVKALLWC